MSRKISISTRDRVKSLRELDEKTIERIYYKRCSGLQVNVMDLGKIFEEGHRLIAAGVNTTQLEDGIYNFTKTIAKN